MPTADDIPLRRAIIELDALLLSLSAASERRHGLCEDQARSSVNAKSQTQPVLPHEQHTDSSGVSRNSSFSNAGDELEAGPALEHRNIGFIER